MMMYLDALKAAKNNNDNFVCRFDKNRGWIVWDRTNGPFVYPYIKGSKKLSAKTVSILKKKKDWQIADINEKIRAEKKVLDLSSYIMGVVAPDDEVW